jgi:hypothetical protein
MRTIVAEIAGNAQKVISAGKASSTKQLFAVVPRVRLTQATQKANIALSRGEATIDTLGDIAQGLDTAIDAGSSVGELVTIVEGGVDIAMDTLYAVQKTVSNVNNAVRKSLTAIKVPAPRPPGTSGAVTLVKGAAKRVAGVTNIGQKQFTSVPLTIKKAVNPQLYQRLANLSKFNLNNISKTYQYAHIRASQVFKYVSRAATTISGSSAIKTALVSILDTTTDYATGLELTYNNVINNTTTPVINQKFIC